MWGPPSLLCSISLELIREAVEKMSPLGFFDLAIGLLKPWLSVADFTDSILLFVVRELLAFCHHGQRNKSISLQKPFQKSLHWPSFCSLPRKALLEGLFCKWFIALNFHDLHTYISYRKALVKEGKFGEKKDST